MKYACLFVIALCALSSGGIVQGATLSAASCSQIDVQAAIDAAQDGDTVLLPAGTATWTKTVTIGAPGDPNRAKFITLQGAGMDKTVIIHGVDPNNALTAATNFLSNALAVFAKPGGITRITGLTFNGGSLPGDPYNKGILAIHGNSRQCRVDHVHFIVTRCAGLMFYAVGGVVDHNVFDLVGWHFGIYGFNGNSGYGGHGDLAWSQPHYAGTDVPFFIEDNVFNGTTINTVAHDGWNGERVVLRHNTLKNAVISNHGTESGGRYRAARFSEVYHNTFTFTNMDYYAYHPLSLRGGNGVFFNNTVTAPIGKAPPYEIPAAYHRDVFDFHTWGAADGHAPFDLNDPILYASGSHTGLAGSANLTDASKNWASNQWIGYSLRNMTKGFGTRILGNTANSIQGAVSSWGPARVFDPGDTYEIKKVIAGLDQTGRGQGDLLTGITPINSVTGTAVWPRQVSEPSYAWNNTINGIALNIASQSYHIVANRDFFNGIPMPGYTPYIYPHPLVTGAQTPGGDGIAPSAPANVTATAISSSQINLAWIASTDNLGVTGYKIFRGVTMIAAVTGTAYQNTGLTANTTYSYTVTAIDAAGNESLKSSAASATTLPSGGTGGTGLTGLYFNNQDFTALMRTRTDATVNFNWGSGSPDPSIGADTFSARWIGRVQAATSETYTFSVVGDDGVRLWVNNKLIVDKWINQAPTEWSGAIALAAGTKYDVRLDYYENGGGAVCQLLWSTPTRVKGIIPQAQLYPPSATAPVVAIESVSTGKAYVLRTAQVNARMYIDRSIKITGLPSALVGGVLIRTANDDRYVSVANHLTFSVTRASTITIAYDKRATSLPTWLNDGSWTETGKILSAGGSRIYRLYSKSVSAGNVTLGGNQQGISVGAISNYVVIVQPVAMPTASG
jgi:hypothetical protein